MTTWSASELEEAFVADAEAAYDRREEQLGADVMRELERRVLLTVLDRKWREHLYEMDYLREGIGLRAMAQRDPLVEYQREGGDMFNQMMEAFMEEVVGLRLPPRRAGQQAGPAGRAWSPTAPDGRPGSPSAPLVESGPDPDGPGVEVHTVGGDDDELEIEEPAEPEPETPFTRPKISAKGLDGAHGNGRGVVLGTGRGRLGGHHHRASPRASTTASAATPPAPAGPVRSSRCATAAPGAS